MLWVGDSTFARLATCEAWTALHIRSEPLAVNGERPLELMKRLDRIADKHFRSRWRGRSIPSVTTAPHAPAWGLRGRRPPRVTPEQLGRSPRPQEPARGTASRKVEASSASSPGRHPCPRALVLCTGKNLLATALAEMIGEDVQQA